METEIHNKFVIEVKLDFNDMTDLITGKIITTCVVCEFSGLENSSIVLEIGRDRDQLRDAE